MHDMIKHALVVALAIAFAAVLVAAPALACDGPKADAQGESSGK